MVFIRNDVDALLRELKMKFRNLDTVLRNEGELSGTSPILDAIGDQVKLISERFKTKGRDLKNIQIEFQILGDLFGQYIDDNENAWKTHPKYQGIARDFNERLAEALEEIG